MRADDWTRLRASVSGPEVGDSRSSHSAGSPDGGHQGRYPQAMVKVVSWGKSIRAATDICRVGWKDGRTAEDPEDVIDEMLASPEFVLVRLTVFVVLLAVIYGGGPRSGLVPVALLAAVTRAAPRRLL